MNRKKLIEVALPLEPINAEALHRKQKAPKGWPTSFHKWWAQRPLASARAVIFAQMVDDPSSNPDLFPTEQDQERERNRLFKIIEDLVKWENTHNHQVLRDARNEIWKSWRRACAENADHPEAEKLFNPDKLPAFCDPFAGSGSLPLSAQWFGINAYAADLNPVAVLINKAMIEIPPRFAGREPVNPEWNTKTNEQKALALWKGAQGLADDVRYYGQWMREEAEKRIGHVYPKLEITAEIAKDRPDLRSYVGHQVTVIAWLWVRTVKSPNPAFAQVDVPLASTFILSTKTGKEAYVEPVIEDDGYRFAVKTGKPKDPEAVNQGTKMSRGANFRCVMSGTPISGEYIKTEGKGGRMGVRLMAIVAEGTRGRFYVAPTNEQEAAARQAAPAWTPNVAISGTTQYLGVKPYGLEQFSQIYTNRQLLSLATISDLVVEARERIRRDATVSGLPDDNIFLRDGGTNATAYADAIAVYLACVLDRMAYYGSSLTSWLPKDNALRDSMPRQALAMTWDFAEGNPLGHSSGDILTCTNSVSNYLNTATPNSESFAVQLDAQTGFSVDREFIISTDPPYYDNVPYADLSDFFYVWLRRSLRPIFPGLFSTMAVPKNEELVAFSYRHKDKSAAETFFLNGMTQAMRRLARQAHPDFPVSIYYAFKQAESDNDIGTASTGWETFLAAVILAGFTVTGTWPLRTEGAGRIRAKDSNALASSIVLICRPRPSDAPVATRRDFLSALKGEIPAALAHLQASNIAPVDLAQTAIGPGMAVFTRYTSVLDAEGKAITVREALALINQVLDEALAEQEGDFDSDSRWALAWFEQQGFAEGEYGVAEQLSKSKNTSVSGLVDAEIVVSKAGKVRLLKPMELPVDWDPAVDPRLTAWETVHHLVRALESQGESGAATLVAKLGSRAETARELCYRLYTLCERKKRASEALSYNALVQSWPEIARLAESVRVAPTQTLTEQADLV